MNKFTMPFLFVFLYGTLNIYLEKNEQENKKTVTTMPVFISYMKSTPPDSLQDFIKVYLQTKKVEVLNWKEVMALFQQDMQSEMMSLINSGKMDNMDPKKAAELIKSNPVCNVLAMNIFRDTTEKSNFIIDSIQWYVGSMPVKDTNQVRIKFYPDIQNKTNPYTVLKSFSDQVIASKLLK